MAGDVPLVIVSIPAAMGQVRSGRLRAVAVSTAKRTPILPDVPTVAEATGLKKYEVDSWYAVFAPAKTPQAVVDKLTAEIQKIMATPEFKKKAAELGATADYMNPQQLQAHSDAEFQRWGKVIGSAKIQAD
jgi:tripartite-type tricarboxylate transporter receptor subunit TctC